MILFVYESDRIRLDCLIEKSNEYRILKETGRKKFLVELTIYEVIRDPYRLQSLVDFTYHFHSPVLNTLYHDTSTIYKFSNFHPI